MFGGGKPPFLRGLCTQATARDDGPKGAAAASSSSDMSSLPTPADGISSLARLRAAPSSCSDDSDTWTLVSPQPSLRSLASDCEDGDDLAETAESRSLAASPGVLVSPPRARPPAAMTAAGRCASDSGCPPTTAPTPPESIPAAFYPVSDDDEQPAAPGLRLLTAAARAAWAAASSSLAITLSKWWVVVARADRWALGGGLAAVVAVTVGLGLAALLRDGEGAEMDTC